MDPFTITAAVLIFGGIAVIKGADSYGEAAGKEASKSIAAVAIVGVSAFFAYKYLQKRGKL